MFFFYDYTEYTTNANNKQDIKFHIVPWVVLLNERWWVAEEVGGGRVVRVSLSGRISSVHLHY